MKILIPQKVTTTGMANPYLFLLIREFYKNKRVLEVQHGYGWLYEPVKWDIIHLHWPEYLVKSQLPDMTRTDLLKSRHFKKVVDAISQKKENGSKILLTVHNEKPHKDQAGVFEQFYEDIYQLSDGFIHLGEFSERKLKEVYPETKARSHFVIPHGDYSYFQNDLKRSECRKKLNIDDKEKLLLTFGEIRSKKELDLGIDAFKNANVENSIFMITGILPNPYRSKPEYYGTRKKLFLNAFNKRIRNLEMVIAPEDVQLYLKAADLVFIQRFNTLNSGNIALGFTFGKVVIGPDYGVIGEGLKETGNPVFNPHDLATVSEAIKKGFILAEAGHGIKNKEYANQHMQWEQIAAETIKAYHSL